MNELDEETSLTLALEGGKEKDVVGVEK